MGKKKETKVVAKETETPLAEAKKTHVEKNELKGQVKQVKETMFKALKRNGEIVAGTWEGDRSYHKNFLKTFDEKGQSVESHVFGPNGETYLMRFNERGDLIDNTYRKSDGSLEFVSEDKYDENGHGTEHFLTYPDGKIMSRQVYTIDEQGRRIKTISYNADESISYISHQTYEGDTIFSDYISVDKDGNKKRGHTWLYDLDYNILEEKEYDDAGHCVETKKPVYQFDATGKRIPIDDEEDVHLKYYKKNVDEVDSHGNWIKRISYFKKSAINISFREITYHDDESKNITLDILMKENAVDTKDAITGNPVLLLNEEQAKWITEGAPPETFPLLRYFVSVNKEFPSQFVYADNNVEVFALKQLLMEKYDVQVLHSYTMTSSHYYKPRMIRFSLSFLEGRYLLSANQISVSDSDEYDYPSFMYKLKDFDWNNLYTSQLQLLHPSDSSGKRDLDFEDELYSLIDMCKLYPKPDKPEIYMVQVNSNGYLLEGHSVDDNFEITDLDINYGQGFTEFHEELMDRFENENKGLVLFHGEPGTGKTYYIRHLLREMANKNKIVIYMPPNMVDYMVEPQFMSFISSQVKHYSEQGYFCVILIEDAEPLLASRSSDTRIQGVSNLLNMTDGLLNDMLNLQIICTFNVKVSKLDKALLRPGRLLARKEFKALPELEANILASRLGIKHHFTAASTLAEIYAMVKSKNTLIHDVD